MASMTCSSARATGLCSGRTQAPKQVRSVRAQAVSEVATRRGMLSIATLVGMGALAKKSYADDGPFYGDKSSSNSKKSDNPVVNDANSILNASKAESAKINNDNVKEGGNAGLGRIEVPQLVSNIANPNRLEGNDSYGAMGAKTSQRPDKEGNALQRFSEATAENFKSNIQGGDIESARKAAAQKAAEAK